jgi:hypothetical protein
VRKAAPVAGQKLEIRLPNGWAPRKYQESAWKALVGGKKRACLVWHRRAGKDDLALHYAAVAAHSRVGGYWHMLPEAAQARKAIWLAVNPKTGKRRIDEAFPVELRESVNDQEMLIRFKCGSTWQVVGSDNYNSLVGSSVAGIVFSEYALANPAAWAYLRPIVRENKGWAMFISTPRGKNHLQSLYRHAKNDSTWFAELLKADQTQVFSRDELDHELKELQDERGDSFGKALWLQEYFCSFDAALPGSIFGEWLDRAQTEERITRVEFDPAVPVHTAWDLGFTDETAIWWFQIVRGEIHVLSYYENALRDIPFYAAKLRAWIRERPGARYGLHWLPHDARARTQASGGKSIQQQMLSEKVGTIVIAKRLDHVDGIQAARKTIPRCWFDADGCELGLEALRAYHYEWDEERRTFTTMPKHDWASHAASAFRTLSLSWKVPKNPEAQTTLEDALLASNPSGMTFGAMKERHLARMRAQRDRLFN